MPIKP